MLGKNFVYLFGLVSILCILFSAQVYSLGVTRPVPHDIELMRGEEANFRFQIQAVTSQTDLSCVYSFSGLNPLEIIFTEDETIVKAGEIKDIYGTVKIPDSAEFKTYNGKLSVSCGATGDVSGSSVRTTIGDSPFNVDVVEQREREIREVTPPETGMDYTLYIVVAVIVIIVAIIALYYLRTKKKKRKKK